MQITIYSTSTCSACHELTRWLEKEGRSYILKITDEDPAVMAEFMAVNGGMVAVPFTVLKSAEGAEEKISGFDQAKFKRALGLQ